MKVLILGTGGMGQVTARTIASFPFVKSVIVADLNRVSAEQTAAAIGAKATYAHIDVSDTPRLEALCASVDLVLNTVGPFYRFGLSVLEAAIQTGKHYADINDDWQPTGNMLLLHDKAYQAGITAIIGLGASPGISNMLALEAARRLDKVESLLTGWDTIEALNDPSSLSDTPSAALIHWLAQLSGKIRMHINGMQTDVLPLQQYRFNYPGYGDAVVWTVGHPEPITLPHYVPNVRFSANMMSGNQEVMQLLQHLSSQINSGLLTLEAAAHKFLDEMKRNAGDKLVVTGARLPSLFAVAFGQKAGQSLTVATSLKALPGEGMGGATGVPLALAAVLMQQGYFDRAGVYPPEGILTPHVFFDLLAEHVPEALAKDHDLLEITSAPVITLTKMQST